MTLTVKEMNDLIGDGWYKDTIDTGTLVFPVTVLDARVVYGNTQVLITPRGDMPGNPGKRWVSRDKVITGLPTQVERERAAGIIGTLKVKEATA